MLRLRDAVLFLRVLVERLREVVFRLRVAAALRPAVLRVAVFRFRVAVAFLRPVVYRLRVVAALAFRMALCLRSSARRRASQGFS